MGWLRNLMAEGESNVRSLGALARALLASPAWGDARRPQSRSLAALLSKLDRGLELEWLAERPHVQLALADVLKCPVSEVHSILEVELPGHQHTQGRLRLDDLRFGRTVALELEPPCPGIPARVLNPTSWNRTWWVAPAGTGKTFAGLWLEARGLASHVTVQCWTSDTPALSSRRPVLVELGQPSPEPSVPTGAPPLCVAAPFEPESTDGWDVVRSPPIESFIDDLIEWVAERLPEDGHFDPALARKWFRSGPIESGLVDSLGTALGLCGALDEEGFRLARGSRVRELAARSFARRVAERVGPDSPDAPWLRKNGFDVLTGIARRLLTDANESWSAPRPLESWLALIPAEYQREVDVDWLRATLADGQTAFRDVDVQRAARRLPPGAYRIVRGLRAARNLVEVAPGAFTLRPLWLLRIVLEEAKRELVEGSPFEYGEALLAPHAAEGIARALYSRILRDDTEPIEAVTELEADTNPAHIAALEVVVRATGMALMAGHDLPSESLEALWHEQSRLAIRWNEGPPCPRIRHQVPVGSLLHDTTWRLALIAISERLDAPGFDPWLAPWTCSEPPGTLLRLLDPLAEELGSFSEPLAHDTYALVDRLRRVLGSLNDPLHDLEIPAAVLDAARLGVLDWNLVTRVGEIPYGSSAVQALAQRRGQSWSETATAIWEAWAESDTFASEIPWFASSVTWGESLGPHLPLEVLRGDALRRLDIVCGNELLDEHIELLVDRYGELAARGRIQFWQTLPSRWSQRALARVTPAELTTARVVWSRFEAMVPAQLAMSALRDRIDALLSTAPRTATREVIRCLAAVPRDKLSDNTVESLRYWLSERIQERAPGFTEAYALLATIERELRHASAEGVRR